MAYQPTYDREVAPLCDEIENPLDFVDDMEPVLLFVDLSMNTRNKNLNNWDIVVRFSGDGDRILYYICPFNMVKMAGFGEIDGGRLRICSMDKKTQNVSFEVYE